MRSRSARSALASPVLVGAVTLLVIIVAIFLSYNANAGLPFVPTTQVKVISPNATKLVVGNEVREGGFRIGVVDSIEPQPIGNGRVAALLTLKIDQEAAPLPRDTTVALRPRSALGLRYVQLVRGKQKTALPDGGTVRIDQRAIAPELEDFFSTFNTDTRTNIQANLTEFAGAFVGRGEAINRTLAALPGLLEDIEPTARLLADPDTGLGRFFDELEDGARVAAPVSDDFARGFASAADTFEAISRSPRALQDTIERSPETLAVGTRSFRAQRPFLRNLAAISPLLRTTAGELRRSLPVANGALRAGTRVLPQTPALAEDTAKTLDDLKTFSERPATGQALTALTDTVDTLNPTIKFAGPAITVCNYWNAWWTFFQDHISEEDNTGTVQRIQVKSAPDQQDSPASFGASQPANSVAPNPLSVAANGDPVDFHGQTAGRFVDENGNADCENGQRGYPERLANGAPPEFDIATDARTPGNQGPTFTGLPRVPEGQTFTAEPDRGPGGASR